VVRDGGALAVEVLSTHQVVPTIQMLDSPPRLVIDLANARIGLTPKRTPVLQEDLLTLRTEQYKNDPPVVRIVLDLLVPYGYTWDIADNRLMVRLKPVAPPNKTANKAAASQPPQALSLMPGGTPALLPVAAGIGEVISGNQRSAMGSSLAAGEQSVSLRLSRGGEVRVCPGTTISVTPSKNSKDLMLGMSTGALETHYALSAATDTVLTPDFRISFAGPGEFDFAVSTDSHGNTCVRGLAGNASPATVSELIGDRTYQVKAGEQAVFRSGRIDKVDGNIPPDCGCPAWVPVMRTDATSPQAAPGANSAAELAKPKAAEPQSPQTLSSGPETKPLPPGKPDDVSVQVDVPIVFRGKKSSAAPDAAVPTEKPSALAQSPPAPAAQPGPAVPHPTAAAQNTPPPASAPRRFFRRLKGFFSGAFH
jgi:AMIN domain